VKRRIIAAVAAVVSAVLGAVLLLAYVSQADRRAMAGMETATVLVAKQDVPAGTASTELRPLVTSKLLPAVAVAPGAVRTLDELGGLVAASDVKAGEQLMASRFADPATLAEAKQPKVPAGMHELSLRIDSQRVLGGELQPNAKVGVFVSVGDNLDNAQTHLILPAVLVTKVVGGAGTTTAEGEDGSSAPTETVQVTLALRPVDAEKVVFGAEHGTIWLSLATTGSTAAGTRVVNGKNVYR
jgi:pilus assembly protein CpaB